MKMVIKIATIVFLMSLILIVGCAIPQKTIEKDAPIEVKQVENPFSSLDVYTEQLINCGKEIKILSDKESYTGAKEKILGCKKIVLNGVTALNNLKSSVSSDNQRFYNYLSLNNEVRSGYLDLLYAYVKTMEYKQNHNQSNREESDVLISYYNDYFVKYETYVSILYLSKRDYPEFFPENSDKNTIEVYKQTNHIMGDYYDKKFNNYWAKYFLQVNPNSPAVIEQTDKLTQRLGGNDNAIEWIIFNFVRDNTQYKHDPNWQTDWVYSPGLTLFAKEGDCDDHAVLLASMFLRAGISEVKLCFTNNHAFVYADGYNWDATCKSCTDTSAPQEDQSQCYDINQYLFSLGKCNDGTLYEECSSAYMSFFCDGSGNLIKDCSKCGCPRDFPYCHSISGTCFSCPLGSIPGEDNLCHQTCGDANHYCPTGTFCRDGKCY